MDSPRSRSRNWFHETYDRVRGAANPQRVRDVLIRWTGIRLGDRCRQRCCADGCDLFWRAFTRCTLGLCRTLCSHRAHLDFRHGAAPTHAMLGYHGDVANFAVR